MNGALKMSKKELLKLAEKLSKLNENQKNFILGFIAAKKVDRN